MATDFLSSDIAFPSNSPECKLSHALSKSPLPVDWEFHDYYTTAVDKAFTPVHSLTELIKLEPVDQEDFLYEKPQFSIDYWKTSSLAALQKDKPCFVFLPQKGMGIPASKTKLPMQTPCPMPRFDNHPLPMGGAPKQQLRAALCGALDMVENDIQRGNHHKATSQANSQALHDWIHWKDQACADRPSEENWDSQTLPVDPSMQHGPQDDNEGDTVALPDKAIPSSTPWSYKRLWHALFDKFKKSSTPSMPFEKPTQHKQQRRRRFWKRV